MPGFQSSECTKPTDELRIHFFFEVDTHPNITGQTEAEDKEQVPFTGDIGQVVKTEYDLTNVWRWCNNHPRTAGTNCLKKFQENRVENLALNTNAGG